MAWRSVPQIPEWVVLMKTWLPEREGFVVVPLVIVWEADPRKVSKVIVMVERLDWAEMDIGWSRLSEMD